MKIKQLRTFIPSKDFEESIRFYTEMGMEIQYRDDELCIVGQDTRNFFIQKFYVEDWANNMMLQMFVDDLDELYTICEGLVKKYPNTKIKPIFEADYGRTFHLIGPAGELWHMMDT